MTTTRMNLSLVLSSGVVNSSQGIDEDGMGYTVGIDKVEYVKVQPVVVNVKSRISERRRASGSRKIYGN